MKRAIKKKPIAKPAPLAQQLDKAVEKIMSDRESKLPRVNSRIAGILRIASELRDLPAEDFKARLKQDLVSRATPMSASAPKKASYIPAGYHTANACLVVRDAPRAIEFYKQAFGATELMRLDDPSGNIIHAQIKIGDSPIDIAPEQGNYNRSPQSLGGSTVPIGTLCRGCRCVRRARHRGRCEGDFPDRRLVLWRPRRPFAGSIRAYVDRLDPQGRCRAGRDDASHGGVDEGDAERRAADKAGRLKLRARPRATTASRRICR